MHSIKCTWSIFSVLVGLTFVLPVSSQNVFVTAPNTFRIGEKETVAIYSQSGVQNVKVIVADLGKKNIIFQTTLNVNSNKPEIIEVQVNPKDIPDLNITDYSVRHYVSLMVNGSNFSKETKVLVALQSGYIFLQTDKPIYNPTQPVMIRVIRLNEDMVIDSTPFTLQIRNPQNTIVHSLPHKDHANKNGTFSTVFNFPRNPLYGEWSVEILYGFKVQLNSSVKFELRKYVLPTFEIIVKVPEVILPDDQLVSISLTAEYVFGKKVDGVAVFVLKVKTGRFTEQFGSCIGKKLDDGKAYCNFNTTEIKNYQKIGWFPSIAGAKLVVEALVYENSSGYKENRTVDSTIFSTSPYVISFGKSLTTYIAGLNTVVLAQINHLNGNPAKNVIATISVLDENKTSVYVDTPNGTTNEEGLVSFIVQTKLSHESLNVTVESKSQNQSVSDHLILYKFKSKNSSYVGINRDSTSVHKVGNKFSTLLYCHPQKDTPMFFMVLSKGKIVKAGSLFQTGTHQRNINFDITPQMIPSARVVVFATHEGQLLVDSLKIDVEKICNPQGNVEVEVTSESRMEPGNSVSVKIKGKEDTVVGILAVDKAVYALRNKDRLTKEKMFSEMEKHDMGCGAGGGLDSAAVLANAGVVMMTDMILLDQEKPSCAERKLRKRAIQDQITQDHGQENRECCKAGLLPDIHKRTCEERAEILKNIEENQGNMKDCSKAFLACCSEKLMEIFGRSLDENDPLIDDEIIDKLLEDTRERKDFKETWLFGVDFIGSSGVLIQPRNLPDSITTWIVQVVGFSTTGAGMCVAEPIEVVVLKNLFLDVKVPYSVVTNEQIEIPVTVFNYQSHKQLVYIFMNGVEGICSEAELDTGMVKKAITVDAKSSETVAFQMIPLKSNRFPLKFNLISNGGGDGVIKTLNVIHEGVPQEKSFYFTIDPSNTEKRVLVKRSVDSENYVETTFDIDKKKQTSVYTLKQVTEFVVPGTEYVIIEAIGDKFGPTVNTSLENPDALLALPSGCGEQTMTLTAPTIYTLHYLKATGKITPQQEEKAYKFIREGYNRMQSFRNQDGSFSTFQNYKASTWLTTFVAKVFCQAARYIFIDETVVCSALKWLVGKQKQEGSFFESQNLYNREMKGGISGDVPLTAYALMAFSQCQCDYQNLTNSIANAVKYLTDRISALNDYYPLAITTYALALHDPALAKNHIEKLLQLSTFDHVTNRRYWGDGESPLSFEASSYALLTLVLLSERDKATSVVNFMNSHRKNGGAFWTTQDTVAAIEALSEYAIMARDPDVSLVMNISTNNDYNFKETWQFRNHNARVLRQAELSRYGGQIFVEAEGSGAGLFGVRYGYNVANNPDTLCKFEMKVNVTENRKKGKVKINHAGENNFDSFVANKTKRNAIESPLLRFGNMKPERVFGMDEILGDGDIANENDLHDVLRNLSKLEVPAQDQNESGFKSRKFVLEIEICCRYLGNENTSMAIVDVGMLTGFKPENEDLLALVKDNSTLIDKFEEHGRNLVFYLEKIPNNQEYCFSFHIKREFIASKLESGLVRVYDYYKPDDACSQFYRSSSEGPALNIICVGKICQCSDGGCPLDPTDRIKKIRNRVQKPKEVAKMACEEYDYFFKVKVNSRKLKKDVYLYYNMTIDKVLKEGRGKKDELEGEFFTFLAMAKCEQSQLTVSRTYYLMGRDPEQRERDVDTNRVYFIGKSSMVKEWRNVRDKNLAPIKRNIQIIFNEAETLFENNGGCKS